MRQRDVRTIVDQTVPVSVLQLKITLQWYSENVCTKVY